MTEPAAKPRLRRVREMRGLSTSRGVHLVEVDDRGGPRSRLGRKLGRSQTGFVDELGGRSLERAGLRAHDPPPHQRHAQAGEAGGLVPAAQAEGEHVEGLERVHRVGASVWQVHDAITGPDLGCSAPLPGEPAASQDVEDLLLEAVLVGRRRPAARRNLDSPQADAERSRGLAEHCPAAAQVSQLVLADGGVVEVGDSHQR